MGYLIWQSVYCISNFISADFQSLGSGTWKPLLPRPATLRNAKNVMLILVQVAPTRMQLPKK